MIHESNPGHQTSKPNKRSRKIRSTITAAAATIGSLSMAAPAAASSVNHSHDKPAATAVNQNLKFYPQLIVGRVLSSSIAEMVSGPMNVPVDEIIHGKPEIFSNFSTITPIFSQRSAKPITEVIWTSKYTASPDEGNSLYITAYKDKGGKEISHLKRESQTDPHNELEGSIRVPNVNGHPAFWVAGRLVTNFMSTDIEVEPGFNIGNSANVQVASKLAAFIEDTAFK